MSGPTRRAATLLAALFLTVLAFAAPASASAQPGFTTSPDGSHRFCGASDEGPKCFATDERMRAVMQPLGAVAEAQFQDVAMQPPYYFSVWAENGCGSQDVAWWDNDRADDGRVVWGSCYSADLYTDANCLGVKLATITQAGWRDIPDNRMTCVRFF